MFRIVRRAAATLALFSLTLPLASCYSLKSAGGFPPGLRTIFIAPLENKTVKFELDTQINRELNEKLPRALGIRPGAEKTADAVLRGEITMYTDAAQNYRPGTAGNVTVLQHQVQITIAVRLIDVKRNAYIWESTGIMGSGEYRPDTQGDEVARAKAIEMLIQRIVDGAQSQW